MELTFENIQKILSTVSSISLTTAKRLFPHTEIITIKKNTHIENDGTYSKYEFFVLNGTLRSYLYSNRGDDVTIDFHTAMQPIPAALLRTMGGKSFVNIEVISETAEIMLFSQKGMAENLQGITDLETYGFRLIMHYAFEKAEREKLMITATGKEKLAWFRRKYPNLENQIPHYYIASFLGITPTSLSRLRKLSVS